MELVVVLFLGVVLWLQALSLFGALALSAELWAELLIELLIVLFVLL